jgi:hypothetical protein
MLKERGCKKMALPLETLQKVLGVDLEGGVTPFENNSSVVVSVTTTGGERVQVETRPITVTEFDADGPTTSQVLKPVGKLEPKVVQLLSL